MEAQNPSDHIPLTNLAFHILLALADEPRHGYAIIQDIEERTDGAMRLRSGTLYTAFQRLEQAGLIAEAGRRPAPDRDDQRRRYYEITRLPFSFAFFPCFINFIASGNGSGLAM